MEILLEEWVIIPRSYGRTYVQGKVGGKKRHTSPVVAVNVAEKTITTRSGSVYKLGDCKDAEPLLVLLDLRVRSFMDGQQYLRRIKVDKKLITAGVYQNYPIYRSDILIKNVDGGYMKINGVCMSNLPIADSEVEPLDRVVVLQEVK